MREFTLVDPSGNLVRIGHDLGDAYIPQDSKTGRERSMARVPSRGLTFSLQTLTQPRVRGTAGGMPLETG